jgi:tripartite-type tricarboxylate transporter receptor subunit TctC
VRILLGITPGGGTDIVARAVAHKLSEQWGRSVVVENRAGAAGVIAMEMVAKATPDGYTLYIATLNNVATATMLKKVPFDTAKVYVPVVQITTQPYVLIVIPSLQVNTVKDLIAYAKAKPGALNYASSGKGTASHTGMELLKVMTGMEIQHVPYSGVSVGMIDLLGGRVQAMLGSALTVAAMVKSGKVKALATSGPQRLPTYPDVPTISESGVPGYDVSSSHSMFAPAGTPAAIVLGINKEVNRIMLMPDIKASLAAQGADVYSPNSPSQFQASFAKEVATWTKFFKARPDLVD